MFTTEINKLKRKRSLFMTLSLVMLFCCGVIVYFYHQNELKLLAPIEIHELMLDIPKSMQDYLAVIKSDTDNQRVVESIQSNISLGKFWVETIKFLLNFLQITMAIFLIFLLVKASKAQNKSTSLIPFVMILIVVFNVLTLNLRSISNFDDEETDKKPHHNLMVATNITKLYDYYQRKGVPLEEIEYFTSQLYALILPRHFEPQSIGFTADKIPNRTAYLLWNAAIKNTKPFKDSEQATIQEKALKFETQTKATIKSRLMTLNALKWVALCIFLLMSSIVCALMTVTSRVIKKSKEITSLNASALNSN